MIQTEDQSTPRDGRLGQTLAAYRTRKDISEDTATALAKAELTAAHWEHSTMVRMAEAWADEIEAELFGE